MATAWVEVISTGLNRFSHPLTGSPLRFLWRGPNRVSCGPGAVRTPAGRLHAGISKGRRGLRLAGRRRQPPGLSGRGFEPFGLGVFFVGIEEEFGVSVG